MSLRAAAKQLTIRIQPPPQNIRESTEIYRHLKSFGDIEFYRNFRSETTTKEPTDQALIIYRSDEARRNVFGAIPMTFSIPPPPPPPIPTEGEMSFARASVDAPPPNIEFRLSSTQLSYSHEEIIRKKLYSATISNDFNTTEASPPGVSLSFIARLPKGYTEQSEAAEAQTMRRKLDAATSGGWSSWRDELKKTGIQGWDQIRAEVSTLPAPPTSDSVVLQNTGWGITWESNFNKKYSSVKEVIAQPKGLPSDPTQKSSIPPPRTPIAIPLASNISYEESPAQLGRLAAVNQDLQSAGSSFRRFNPVVSHESGNSVISQRRQLDTRPINEQREIRRPVAERRSASFKPPFTNTSSKIDSTLPTLSAPVPNIPSLPDGAIPQIIGTVSPRVIGVDGHRRSLDKPTANVTKSTTPQVKSRNLIVQNAPRNDWVRKAPSDEEKALLREKAKLVKGESIAEKAKDGTENKKLMSSSISPPKAKAPLSFAERLAQRQAMKVVLPSQPRIPPSTPIKRPMSPGEINEGRIDLAPLELKPAEAIAKSHQVIKPPSQKAEFVQHVEQVAKQDTGAIEAPQPFMTDHRQQQITSLPQPGPPPPIVEKTLDEMLRERSFSMLRTTSKDANSPTILLDAGSASAKLKQLEARNLEQKRQMEEQRAKKAAAGPVASTASLASGGPVSASTSKTRAVQARSKSEETMAERLQLEQQREEGARGKITTDKPKGFLSRWFG